MCVAKELYQNTTFRCVHLFAFSSHLSIHSPQIKRYDEKTGVQVFDIHNMHLPF